MGTATDGGKVFQERTRVSGERPIGAAGFRQQSIQASCQPPKEFWAIARVHKRQAVQSAERKWARQWRIRPEGPFCRKHRGGGGGDPSVLDANYPPPPN